MLRRMPVLRQDHMIKGLGERHDRRDHGAPVRHCKRAARQEVMLHVDDDEHVLAGRSDRHVGWPRTYDGVTAVTGSQLGFKRSPHHLNGGGCDEGWETALGSATTSRG